MDENQPDPMPGIGWMLMLIGSASIILWLISMSSEPLTIFVYP
jgi:hypothetical protein